MRKRMRKKKMTQNREIQQEKNNFFIIYTKKGNNGNIKEDQIKKSEQKIRGKILFSKYIYNQA